MANSTAYLRNVGLSYDGHVVLDGANLSVEAGETFGILGRIGSGKTRILRLIAGLEKPDAGEAGHAGRASYVFQNDLLIPWLTVGENLRLCLRDKDQADWSVYERLGIPEFEDKRPFQLSGGMRKKVNFARGFINGDPLVLMDEPFGALDPAQKREIQASFLAEKNKTAIVVTHDVREALLVCDRIAFLSMRDKKLTEPFKNPYRGRFEAEDLLADPGYRALYQRALDFYNGERA